MNFQQLQYAIALSKHKHFLKAAEECGVTQPTLSAMIHRMEEELDVKIFDRSSHPISLTPIGEQIVAQAKVIMNNMEAMGEIVKNTRDSLSGSLHIGMIPTVAPYLLPKFIEEFIYNHPSIELKVSEMRTSVILSELKSAQLDMAILSTPIEDPDFLTIPLFYERFYAYISPREGIYSMEELTSHDMPIHKLWVMHEGHCFRNQVFNFCEEKELQNSVYEAGSIHTLIGIVDQTGGYTIIPELHIPLLNSDQKKNLRPIVNPIAVREISILIRKDYIREKLLNCVADVVKKIIPVELIDERLKKYSIKI